MMLMAMRLEPMASPPAALKIIAVEPFLTELLSFGRGSIVPSSAALSGLLQT